MAIDHNHIAVIGRLDGDDNEIVMYENMTTHQAEAAFDRLMKEHALEYDDTNTEPTIYIDYILTSESPIVPHFCENP